MASQPVLCKGATSANAILPLSISDAGALNIATAAALDVDSTQLPATIGQKTKGASLAVTLASDEDALPVTGTFYPASQPVSGTVAVSGISGTTLVSSVQLPTSIGQTTMSGSTSVVLASDQSSIPVSMSQSAASSSDSLSITAGATDTSVSKDTSGYSKVGILVSSDQTDTTVQLKFSHDNSSWFAVEAARKVEEIAEIGGGSAQNTLYFNASPLAKYVRVDVKHPGTGTAAATVLTNLH